MIFATLLVGLAYPVVGSWHWGGGWLGGLSDGAGFKDFAGSAVVHAFGGFSALACVLLLGPRAGKYVDGRIRPILGHSMPLATIGVFLLFFGWFGFNGGSVLSADPSAIGLVFTTTALAASAGALGSILVSWVFLKKPDLSMALNGILAGLVGITSCADIVSVMGALVVGLIAGVIVVFAIIFFDKVKIDDPVGAISVHGVCGAFGILVIPFVNISEDKFTFAGQFIGLVAVAAAAFTFSIIVFGILKFTIGIRVSSEEETEGLDIGEHGQEAYPDFANSSR
jgi:Amt family ammonium transporter